MKENVPTADSLSFRQANNGELLIFDFVGADKSKVSLAINAEYISFAAAGLLRAAAEFGSGTPIPEKATMLPVPISGVAIQQGSTPTEAHVVLHTGTMTLLFAVPVELLRPQCERLLKEASNLVPRPKAN